MELPALSAIMASLSVDSPPPDDVSENGLTERELRELYDNEEVEQFLHLFSAVSNVLSLPGVT